MTLARVLGSIGRFLIALGTIVLLFVGFQLWGTSVQEAQAQSSLEKDFDALLDDAASGRAADSAVPSDAQSSPTSIPVRSSSTPADLTSLEPEVLAAALLPQQGAVAARLELPTIEVTKLVVEGVQVADLRKGPGHYRSTPLPGMTGNTGIAGHRTTYGQPFHDIDQLAPGDQITVESLLGTFIYEVMTPQEAFGERLLDATEVGPGFIIVSPDDTWVLGDFGDNRLTLTACHPKLSAQQRLIVAARLIGDPADTPPSEVLAQLEGLGDGELGPDETVQDAQQGQAGSFVNEVSLDEGLDGDRSAARPAVLWAVAVMIVYLLVGAGFRRGDRMASLALGVAPFAGALWLCFEHVDRLLPAY